MFSRRIVAACLLAVVPLGAGSAAAQSISAPSNAAPGAQSSPAAEAEDITVIKKRQKRVCKSSVETGSIIPKRVCRSNAEWDEITERSLVELERLRRDQRARRMVQETRENQVDAQ